MPPSGSNFGNHVATNILHTERITIGTTGTQLSTLLNSGDALETECVEIFLRADTANAGAIHYAARSDVSATGAATDGMPLYALDGVIVPCTDPAKLYIEADQASQVLYVEVRM